ncbi:hypothetical protein, partial [Mycobacterium sp.]|uniref:hypothetical protein n=1 Tax=Mycobacterium sp. TaxID=1785 RepID=UPI003A87AE3A
MIMLNNFDNKNDKEDINKVLKEISLSLRNMNDILLSKSKKGSSNPFELVFNILKNKSLIIFFLIFLYFFIHINDSFNNFTNIFFNSLPEVWQSLLIFIYQFSFYVQIPF